MQTDRAKPHGCAPYFDCEADATLARSVEPESDAFPFDNARALDPRPPAFTDEALALRFAEIHANGLRYVERWGRWLSYDGVRWRFDDTLLAFDRARKICRQASVECNDPRVAKALASASTVAGVIKLSPADRRLAASVDQWDSDPWVLNTPGGVVDLRTGESEAGHRELGA